MNQAQINEVKEVLDHFSSIDVAEILAEKFECEGSLSNVQVVEYRAEDYVSSVNKVVAQFLEEIDSVYARALPFQYHFQNEYGGGSLAQDLASLFNNISSHNFQASVINLNRLIHYQAINGFWEKSKRKYFKANEASIKTSEDALHLASKHAASVSKTLSKLLNDFESQKEDVREFFSQKQTELEEIQNLHESAAEDADNIKNLFSKASSTVDDIKSKLEESSGSFDGIQNVGKEAEKMLVLLADLIADNKQSIEKQEKQYSSLAGSFEEKLEFVESKRKYFEERNSYLDDLVGREVGASLFETFKHRKGELSISITFWKFTVPFIALLNVAWVYFLFGFGDLSELSWQAVLVNTLKAFPAVGLLFFSVSQYIKERNFQEEYAFKSAVALTINSYANQLTENENKDKMIMESVAQVYKTPIHHKAQNYKHGEIVNSAKDLIDTAKSVLPDK